MADDTMTVHIRFAWWLQHYLDMLVLFCWLMGTEPDWDKLRRVIRAAIRVKVKDAKCAS